MFVPLVERSSTPIDFFVYTRICKRRRNRRIVERLFLTFCCTVAFLNKMLTKYSRCSYSVKVYYRDAFYYLTYVQKVLD